MEFEYYVRQQLERHKSIQPQDIVKLCYQAAYGAEHMLADMEAARKYFYTEYDSVSVKKEALYEEISQDICRINLSAWKASGMPAKWLFHMFIQSTKELRGSKEMFLCYLQIVEEILNGSEFSLSLDDWKEYLISYRTMGMPAVHHSENYRVSECPAYRIVNRRFLKILPILQRAVLLPEKNKTKVISIDGRAASGKSTMAEMLGVVLDAGIIHMDDFFLPMDLRSDKRFAEAGGNIHYERFREEVLPNIASPEGFKYRVFDCSQMDFGGERQVDESDWRIVEGSYSHHPKFGDYADLQIFCNIGKDEQKKRIIARDGEGMAEVFGKRWIPMEEDYFRTYQIRESADLEIWLS